MTVDPILVDVYAGDLQGHPNHQALVAAGLPFVGEVMKATEGLHYAPPWFPSNWKLAKASAKARLGASFFVGAYHFLRFDEDGAAQADAYMAALDRAGGLLPYDLHPILDIERGGRNHNAQASRHQVIDCASAWTERIKICLTEFVILYGGSGLRDLGITDPMGCDRLWVARYSSILPRDTYQSIGWKTPDLWQYQGTGPENIGRLKGYPISVPGYAGPAQVDLSVFTGTPPTVDQFHETLTIAG